MNRKKNHILLAWLKFLPVKMIFNNKFDFVSQLHAYCYKNIPQECTFGNLEPIYLPPHAVSVPRTEVPMEAIIGVEVRRKEVLAREYSCRKCLPCNYDVRVNR